MDKLGPYLLGPNDENQGIYTGDARDLAQAIPDESVNLIFTDPVYDRIDDYRWLAETAARVLKPDSACLAWCENGTDYLFIAEMTEYLHYVLSLHVFMSGVTVGRHYRGMFIKTSPCLWMEKGHRNPSRRIWDVSIGVSNSRKHGKHHIWGKDPNTIARWITAFSKDGSLILDPFTGGATVPAVCKMLGRRWLAFEIDPPTAELARKRVRETQPPLFVPQPEQLDMALT